MKEARLGRSVEARNGRPKRVFHASCVSFTAAGSVLFIPVDTSLQRLDPSHDLHFVIALYVPFLLPTGRAQAAGY